MSERRDAREPAESSEESERKTLGRLAEMFADLGNPNQGRSGDDWDWPAVVCPFCPLRSGELSSYVHIERREVFLGKDNYEASGRYHLGVRGDVTALHFWCEERHHRWVLGFGENKGELFVRVVRLTDLREADLTEYEGDS
jgi:hypothetical protein